MRRLFWKSFLAVWVTLILAGAVTLAAIRISGLSEPHFAALPGGHRAQFELDTASEVLRHAGPDALVAALDATDSIVIVADPDGHDIRGRIPNASLEALIAEMSQHGAHGRMRSVQTPRGIYTLLVQAGPAPPARGSFPPPPGPPAPWEPLVFAFLASLALAAMLAWYLARPVRGLRTAFTAMAEGRLDTRLNGLLLHHQEFRELARAFDLMAERLQNLILAQRRLLHDVSHELRSPLGRLQVALGIIRQDPSRSEATLERMEREVERLNGLIGEILILSRLNSGAQEDLMESTDLGELLEEIVQDARFEAQDNGCEVHLTELTRVRISCRPRLVSRAVENVVRNGLRITPMGSALDVTLGVSDGQAVIRVQDQGPGIPEYELESIFEPFHRGRSTTNGDGFGLGLAIARRSVELHGGRILAINAPEGGLLVEIRLPGVSS
jgi:two-component system OmpR family sensor kinase